MSTFKHDSWIISRIGPKFYNCPAPIVDETPWHWMRRIKPHHTIHSSEILQWYFPCIVLNTNESTVDIIYNIDSVLPVDTTMRWHNRIFYTKSSDIILFRIEYSEHIVCCDIAIKDEQD